MNDNKVTILGGGSFGTTLANIVAENGFQATLWLRDQGLAQRINSDRVNDHYMPGYELHGGLTATTGLQEAVADSSLIIVSVPSRAFRSTLKAIEPFLDPGQILISSAKGVESPGFNLMSQVMQDEVPEQSVGVLSGPNLAKEIVQRMATATVIASPNEAVRTKTQAVLANNYFRVYASDDMYGVELGGTLKNIYAIISGLAAALGMGENTRSLLITRSLAEMSRFAVSMGANPLTFIGLSGVGDLIVTCMSPLSRNYRVGFALGEGKSLEQAVSELGQVAEGVNTLRLVKEKADELDIYMPLANVLYDVLYNGLSIEQGTVKLMSSEQRADVEFVLPGKTD